MEKETMSNQYNDQKEIKWYQSKFWPVILIIGGCVIFLIAVKMILDLTS